MKPRIYTIQFAKTHTFSKFPQACFKIRKMDAEVGNFPAVSGRTTHALIFSSRLTILSIWTQDLGPQFLQANFQTPADLLGAIGFRMKSILCDQQHLFQTDP